MNLPGLEGWFANYIEALLSRARKPVTITSTVRFYGRQARLYRSFLRGEHPYPVLPPDQSSHQYGIAVDMVAEDAELRRLGGIWRRMGGLWGGSSDPIHFEAGARMLRLHHFRAA